MITNAKKILKRLDEAKKSSKGKVTFYLNKDLYEHFRESCGQYPASTVIEELMKEFIASLEDSKKDSK